MCCNTIIRIFTETEPQSYEFSRFQTKENLSVNPTNAIVQRIQRFSLKDYAQMLAGKPQRAAEEQAERVLAELEKAQESVRTAIADNLDKAQELFTSALPLVLRNIVKKSGALTTQMLENDAAMTLLPTLLIRSCRRYFVLWSKKSCLQNSCCKAARRWWSTWRTSNKRRNDGMQTTVFFSSDNGGSAVNNALLYYLHCSLLQHQFFVMVSVTI